MISIFLLLSSLVSATPIPEGHYHIAHGHRGAQWRKSLGQGYDVQRYDLKATVDWEKKQLNAEVEITLKVLDPHLETLTLDSSVHEVTSVALASGQGLAFSSPDNQRLLVSLVNIPKEQFSSVLRLKIRYTVTAEYLKDQEESAFHIYDPKESDPISSRFAHTNSEPLGTQSWMPCHNDPSDRAIFSFAMDVATNELVISNGRLLKNEVVGGIRQMSYSTDYTLPTYLMAFAVGELVSHTQYHGKVPVSVVHRAGLPGDHQGMVKQIIQMMEHFEKLLVPYPFEKYSLVLVPDFTSGGEENVGITFQAETRSTRPRYAAQLGLTAHELGHQWFGDLVTVKHWDDLWIKEGMATLLAEEASREFSDMFGKNRLLGSGFEPVAGEAVRDPQLVPDAKYTSGPYDRAAWVYTQLRAILGEKVYWNIMREALEKFAFSAIGTDDLLNLFKPHLSVVQFEKLKSAIHAKATPQLVVEKAEEAVMLRLIDDDNALIAPIEVRQYDKLGFPSSQVLGAGLSLTLKPSEGNLLTLDPMDNHPIFSLLANPKEALQILHPLLLPKTEAQWARWIELGTAAQELALRQRTGWNISPNTFNAVYPRLHSDYGRYRLLHVGCEVARQEETVSEAWKSAIQSKLEAPPYLGFPRFFDDGGLAHCYGVMDTTMFAPIWARMESTPWESVIEEFELHYLATLPASPVTALTAWGPLAQSGGSIQARMAGVTQLGRYLKGEREKPTGELLEGYRGILLTLLQQSRSSDLMRAVLDVFVNTKDPAALDVLPRVTTREFLTRERSTAVCVAYLISEKDPAAWEKFKAAVNPAQMPLQVRHLIENPEECKKARR